MVGGRGSLDVQASKGIHLVVPRDRIRSECGFITKTETSVLFVIPWGRHWIIGTTDTPWNLDKAHPAASKADIDYLLQHVNTILREPLDHEDVEGVYAGLRPLARGESEPTSRISREHTVVAPGAGAGDDRRRQADDVPRDGARRRRRRGPFADRRRSCRRARLDHRPGPAGRRAGLRGAHQPAGAAGPPHRPAHLADRPPAGALRQPRRRGARADRPAPRARAAARGRRRLPGRRGGVRRHPRGRPPPRRRAHAAYPHLGRDCSTAASPAPRRPPR